jgi:hypothetical protein
MRVFAVPQVSRLMRKERLSDAILCRAARDLTAGVLRAGEADLGGGLYKKRLARPGSGKRGGYRAIIAYRAPKTERILFAFAFAKSAAATLTPQEQEALARAAGSFVDADDRQLAVLLQSEDVREIACDGDDPT